MGNGAPNVWMLERQKPGGRWAPVSRRKYKGIGQALEAFSGLLGAPLATTTAPTTQRIRNKATGQTIYFVEAA